MPMHEDGGGSGRPPCQRQRERPGPRTREATQAVELEDRHRQVRQRQRRSRARRDVVNLCIEHGEIESVEEGDGTANAVVYVVR